MRWLVFAALFFLAPLPFFLVEAGRVPAARMFQLTAYLVALVGEEGGQGAVVAAAWLIGSQALLYAVALFAAAGLIAAGLIRVGSGVAPLVSLVLIAIALMGSLVMEPYVTPFSLVSPTNGLSGVYR